MAHKAVRRKRIQNICKVLNLPKTQPDFSKTFLSTNFFLKT